MMVYYAMSGSYIQSIGMSFRTMEAEFYTRWFLGWWPPLLFTIDYLTKPTRKETSKTWLLMLILVSWGLWFMSVIGYSALWGSLNYGFEAIVLRDAIERVAVNEGEKCFWEGTSWEDPECMARVAANQ